MNTDKPKIDLSQHAISVDDFNQLKSHKNLTILDVRTKEERDAGYIENSTWIPLAELPHRLSELNNHSTIVVYCHLDGRSRHAANLLLNSQFTSVKFLVGGIVAYLGSNR